MTSEVKVSRSIARILNMGRIKRLLTYLLEVNLLSKTGWKRLYEEKLTRLFTFLLGPGFGSMYVIGKIDFSKIKDKEEPVVLCIERHLFDKDIEQLRIHTKINWVSLPVRPFFRIQCVWLPSDLSNQTSFIMYEEKYQKERARADAFCVRFLQDLLNKQRIDAVMSANVDYAQDESLRRACKQLGIPFLVLSKENCMTPKVINISTNYYKAFDYKFKGDGVAVFGKTHSDMLKEARVCDEEQVWVTGPPRFDAWREVDLDAIKQKNIILLAFLTGYGVQEDYFLNILYTFAAQSNHNTQGSFIVKCKGRDDKEEIQKLLHRRPHRLQLVMEEPLYRLLPTAKLIIGFNSLSLIEALLTKARLVIPHFGHVGNDSDNIMISPADPRVREEFHFADDLEELEAHIIEVASQNGELQPAANMTTRYELFYDFFHKPEEGTFSAEVEKFVRHYITKASV